MLWEVLVLISIIIFIIAVIWFFVNTEMGHTCFKTAIDSVRKKYSDMRKKENTLHFLHTQRAARIKASILEKNRQVSLSLELARKRIILKSKLPNNLEKQIARRSQAEKPMNNKLKNAGQKENDYITVMKAQSVKVLKTDCCCCYEKFESSECTWCPSKHQICLPCIKRVIQNFMNTKDQIHLTCPVENCWEIIDIDFMTRKVDTLTFDLLNSKLLKREESANEEMVEHLFHNISCLCCKTISSMDQKAKHLYCRNCYTCKFLNGLEKPAERWSQTEKLKDSGQNENGYFAEIETNRVEVLGTDCWGCNEKFESSECTWCPSKHRICLPCIKRVIKNFMNTKDQIHLTCPVETCQEIIDIDLVTRQVDPLTFDLLKKKLFKRQESASEEVVEYLFQKISCLSCKTIASMDKKAIHFKCRNCSKEFCSYCHKDWPGSNLHNECRLLNCSGTKCFQELHVPPDNWEKSCSELIIEQNKLSNVSKTSFVNLNGREGRAIISLFIQTSSDLWITNIIRLQNLKLWEKYVLERKHMDEEIGVSNINERVLFHGTNEKNISLISEEGFDMRVDTANGALFGKGTYFSTTSKYSQQYAGLSNKMFMVRVLCGHSVQGCASYKRPPKDKSGRMYDSCVNNESGPSIYCIFDNSQCYPAYVIEYTKKK